MDEGDKIAEIIDPGNPVVYVNLKPDRPARDENPAEARLAADLVRALIAVGVPGQEIAVLSPYQRQNRAIRSKLAEETSALTVDLVERLQGSERDVIIFSLCASDPAYLEEQAGVLYLPNRLNVGLTRARKKLIMLGSRNIFEYESGNDEYRRWVEIFHRWRSSVLNISYP